MEQHKHPLWLTRTAIVVGTPIFATAAIVARAVEGLANGFTAGAEETAEIIREGKRHWHGAIVTPPPPPEATQADK